MEDILIWVIVGGTLAGGAVMAARPVLRGIAAGLRRVVGSLQRVYRKAKVSEEQFAQLERLDAYRQELDSSRKSLERRQSEAEHRLARQQSELEACRQDIERQRHQLEVVIAEKTGGFPWLANAFADYFHLEALKEADRLQRKKHPAPVAADSVREISRQRRRVEAELRVAKYLLHYYESLFPWLVDFRGEDLDDLIERKLKRGDQPQEPQMDDAARAGLTDAEYASLPGSKKYQLALDRYWSKKKSPWEIGRDYERYIGYLYEQDGFHVYYQGIVEGLADMGRDLIARKDRQVEVVQCKYWSRDKTIHEKHIFQLFGTLTAYRVDHPEAEAKGEFVTSTTLSERAKLFAAVLGIEHVENLPLQPYPCIKCNVSRRDGARIYHLPFDQQYDRTLVEEERLECYVATVEEAERLGFRRAFRWKGLGGGTESTSSGQAP
jgi:hypothetical protein